MARPVNMNPSGIDAHMTALQNLRSSGGKSAELAGPVRLAILDDYQNIAYPIFARLGQKVQIHSFRYTLNAKVTSERNELIKRLEPFEVISTMRERTAFPAELLNALPRLKVILTTGMANASIDLKTCKERDILVIGTKGAKIEKGGAPSHSIALSPSLQATAEQTMTLALSVTKLIARNQIDLMRGGWQTDFASNLSGKTLGIVGFGKIGAMVARMASLGFGMHILAWSENINREKVDAKAKEMGLEPQSIKIADSKLDLFREADVISLHYVLSDRSRNMVGKGELDAMKSTGILVNTSRGGLIDEPALLQTLKRGAICGVGLDVFTVEPLPSDSEWRTTRWGEDGRSQAVLSPHMGYAEEKVIPGWYEESAECLEQWLDGKMPASVIS